MGIIATDPAFAATVLDVQQRGSDFVRRAFLAAWAEEIRQDPVAHQVVVTGLRGRRRWQAAAAEAASASYRFEEVPQPWQATTRAVLGIGAELAGRSARTKRGADSFSLGRSGPRVDVLVNGHKATALVDTAAGTSVLCPELVARAGVRPLRALPFPVGDGTGRTLLTHPLVIEELDVGSVRAGPVVAVELDLPVELACDLLLSPLDLGDVVAINAEDASLHVGPAVAAGTDGCDGIELPLLVIDGVPAVEAHARGLSIVMGIDTGASKTLLSAEVSNALRLATTAAPGVVIAASGRSDTYVASDVTITVAGRRSTGDALVRPLLVDASAVGSALDGLLGLDRLRRLTIDVPRGTVALSLFGS